MSTRTTATALRVAPAGAAGLALTSPSPYVYGAWVEFLASASGVVHAAGIAYPGGTWSQSWFEIEIGVGAAAAEVASMRYQAFGPSSGSGYPRLRLFPVPVLVGPAGSRVAIRVRHGGAVSVTLLLLYYLDLVSDHVSPVPLVGAPTGAAGVSVTPSGTAWAWSAWVQVIASTATEIAITGIMPSNPVLNVDVEWEIGVGAAAAEVGITRVRAATATASSGQWRVFSPAAPHPIPAGSRVAVRLRKEGTSTAAHQAQVLYLDGTALL